MRASVAPSTLERVTPCVPVTHPAPDADTPIRDLFEVVARAQATDVPDLPAIARALAAFATDHDHLAHHLARMGDRSGGLALHAPERGPRLMLARRRAGQMGAAHDHGCWVVLATVTGIETHRRFRVMRSADELERLEVASELAIGPGQAVTMLAPWDTHQHGHPAGQAGGYVLVMTGDDQRRYRRREWDDATGRARWLEPGDVGRWLTTEPFTG